MNPINLLPHLIAFLCLACAASTYAVSLSNLRLTHLTGEDGLPHNEIFEIIQDRQEFIWLATRNGLVRYDGNTFVIHQSDSENPQTISHNVIEDIMEDDQGFIWVGTGSGLNRFDPVTEEVIRYFPDPDNPNSISGETVEAILQDNQGIFWFGTNANGLNRYDAATDTFTLYRENSEGEFVGRITDVIEGRNGDIWFVGDRGLHHLDVATGVLSRPQATKDQFSADDVYLDPEGNLWMVTWGPSALMKYNPDTEQLSIYPLESIGALHCNLLDDGDGGFWIPTRDGLYHFDRQTERFTQALAPDFANPTGFNDSTVISIFEDRSGLLWLGSYNGGVNLVNLRQQQFGRQRHIPDDDNSFLRGRVNYLHVDRDNALWLGFYPRGISRIDQTIGAIKNYIHDPNNPDSLSDGINILAIQKNKYVPPS